MTDRIVDWAIACLCGTAIWLLGVHVLAWAARTFGLRVVAGGLVVLALMGLVLALAGLWRERDRARQPWREPTWEEREALR
jgi:hypothetical protein